MQTITFKEIVTSFVKSIDLVSYLLKNHHRRVAVTAYQLGVTAGLSEDRLKNLVLAAALHDIGALTVAERDQLIQMDIENPHPHAILGSMMLEPFRYFKEISKIIRFHHVYWQNGSAPEAAAEEIPFEAYLLHLADRVDILADHELWLGNQAQVILEQIVALKGSVFHPDAVAALKQLSEVDRFWLDIEHMPMDALLDQVLKVEKPLPMDLDLLEELAYTLSRIIDFRSEFTATHSFGVGMVVFELGQLYGMSFEKCRRLRIAGYLHDIGKVAISTEIVEKPARLSQTEYTQMKAHAYYTNLILRDIKGLEDICSWASMHHEKHDGSGYPYHADSSEMSIEMEIMAYADIFTALTENRPYRSAKDNETVLQIIRDEYMPQLSKDIYALIEQHVDELNRVRSQAQMSAQREYQRAMFGVRVGLG